MKSAMQNLKTTVSLSLPRKMLDLHSFYIFPEHGLRTEYRIEYFNNNTFDAEIIRQGLCSVMF